MQSCTQLEMGIQPVSSGGHLLLSTGYRVQKSHICLKRFSTKIVGFRHKIPFFSVNFLPSSGEAWSIFNPSP